MALICDVDGVTGAHPLFQAIPLFLMIRVISSCHKTSHRHLFFIMEAGEVA